MTDIADLVIDVDVDADHVAIRMSRAADKIDREFERAADRAERSGGRLSKVFRGIGDDTEAESDRAESALGRLGGFFRTILGGIGAHAKPIALAAGGLFAGQFIAAVVAGLASGAVKVARGVGAIGALLPAVAVAGVVAFAAVRLAVAGVGDALSAGLSGDTEAYQEALAGLSPAARGFAREVVGLRGELDALRSSVQERFFAPFAGAVERLGAMWLPMLRHQLGGVASSLGGAVDEAAGLLATPAVVKAIDMALGNAGTAIGNVTGGLAGLVAGFVPLIAVGSTFLPQLTAGFGGLTDRFAAFMAEAAATGELASFIQRGLDSLRSLADTAGRLWRILGDIGSIASTVFGASGLGGSAGGVLDTIERLVGRAREFVESAEGATVLEGIFDGLRVAMLAFKGPTQLAGRLLGTLAPLLPDVARLAGALADLGGAVLEVGFEILAPPVAALGVALGFVLPLLTGLATWLANNKPVLQGLAVTIATFLAPAFIAWAAAAIPAAAATIAAALPVILLGAAITALAALVITHFDTIRNAIAKAFNWVKTNWPLLLAILTGPIGLAVLLIVKHWGTIKAGFTAVKDWIAARIGDIVGFFTGLPGRLARAAGDLWGFVSSTFKSAINAVISLWNDFELGPWTIGGWETPGPIPDIPSFTIGPVRTPNLPMLAEGAIATGPTLAMIGEGPHDEAVIPLPRGVRDLAAGGGRGPTINVTVQGSIVAERDIVRVIRDELGRGGFGGVR